MSVTFVTHYTEPLTTNLGSQWLIHFFNEPVGHCSSSTFYQIQGTLLTSWKVRDAFL